MTPRTVATVALLGAVALSGAAGLVNQVAWQRALKVFLGGSEAASALVVVVVFLGGLGLGAALASRFVSRLRDPLRALALVEIGLAAVNAGVCALLARDLGDSVFAVQRAALALGVPLRAAYAVAATLVLGVPCVLMGATTPLAAEVCGRTLGWRSPRQLGVLFAASTGGSVLGVLVGTAWLLPARGQAWTLLAAAGANLAAGLALGLGSRTRPGTAAAEDPGVARRRGDAGAVADLTGSGASVAHDAALAFGLGAVSLAYEMYLLRVLPLRHEPLPYTFGAALLGVLVWWSVGAALAAGRPRGTVGGGLALLAGALLAAGPFWLVDAPFALDDVAGLATFPLARAPYFVPFLLQGWLFTRLAARAARSWGADVGRVYAWNTVGACVGTVLTTLVGYALPVAFLFAAIVLLALSLRVREASVAAGRPRRPWIPLGVAAGLVAVGLGVDTSRVTLAERAYVGPDGHVAVDAEGNVAWDGLWHSRLSRDGDHVGTRNWMAAVVPWLVHAGPAAGEGLDVAVLGLSIGVTASTFARSDTVASVVGYDINRGLARLFRDFPDGTLGVAANPKVRVRWQDARSGLALDAHRYDIVQSQPLYLRQAGSGLLNSLEMMRLVAARLAPGGIFCLYSNGTPEQALLLRATAARVFPGRVSFLDGYLLLLSNEPLDDLDARLRARFARADPLLDEVRAFPATATADAVLALRDPDLSWDAGPLVTTDDRPLVEYPGRLAAEVAALGLTGRLSTAPPAADFASGSVP